MISSIPIDETTVHLVLSGRLDLENTPQLRQLLLQARTGGARYFLMSLSDLEFMDSSGLSALVSGLKAARLAGGELVLIAPSVSVTKLLELTLLNQVIPVVSDLESAQQRCV
ncbi:STAS domain-containing protein [Deinococcus sp.]|uniref:STAS domain-containing protein n=1 Tax=Deinococcus sp. TaxID=47478 RepID=UPI003C7D0121